MLKNVAIYANLTLNIFCKCRKQSQDALGNHPYLPTIVDIADKV